MSRSYNDELQFLDKLSSTCWRIKKGFVPNMQVSSGVFRATLADEAQSVSIRRPRFPRKTSVITSTHLSNEHMCINHLLILAG